MKSDQNIKTLNFIQMERIVDLENFNFLDLPSYFNNFQLIIKSQTYGYNGGHSNPDQGLKFI